MTCQSEFLFAMASRRHDISAGDYIGHLLLLMTHMGRGTHAQDSRADRIAAIPVVIQPGIGIPLGQRTTGVADIVTVCVTTDYLAYDTSIWTTPVARIATQRGM